jgi:hypothetical protein
MLVGKVDGVSPNEQISGATLEAIRSFARARSTIYLPTHDVPALPTAIWWERWNATRRKWILESRKVGLRR